MIASFELICTALGNAVLQFLWQGALIALLVGAILKTVSRTDSATRHAIGLSALILCLLAFTGSFILALRGSPVGAEAVLVIAPLTALLTDASGSFPVDAGGSFDLRLILAWGWIAGVVLMGIRFGRGQAWVRGLKRAASMPVDPIWQSTVDSLSADLGLRRAVRLLQSAWIESPAVIGWIKPVIVVPIASLTGLSPEQLRCVLAHELAHVRRLDHLVNALLALLEVTLFFHPAIWWFSNLVRQEREHCCDFAAVRATGNPRLLAQALTELESIRILNPAPILAARSDGGPLMKRITRILAMNPKNATRDGGRRLRVVFFLASVLGGAGVIQATITESSTPAIAEAMTDEHDDAEFEYRSVEKKVLAAVQSGQITLEQASSKLADVRKRIFVRQKSKEDKWREVEAREEHARETREYDRTREEYSRVARELDALVDSGQVTREQANRRLAGFKERLTEEVARSEDQEKRRRGPRDEEALREIEQAAQRLEAAVESGRVSREDANRRMAGFSRRQVEEQARRGEARTDSNPRLEYERAAQALEAAVESGRISAEDAKKRMAALKARMAQADPHRGEGRRVRAESDVLVDNDVQRTRREEYALIERKVKAGVEAGTITLDEGKRKLLEARARLFPAPSEGTGRGGARRDGARDSVR
ncbi:MAG: beta-lactamase regulating signal transducer with metallopeptidase domain [Planctomycetota bacterium]|jgi:beta-lactamase regulating signal transducer with metallopeptidase domain